MKNKGQATSLSQILASLVIIFLIASLLFYFFKGHFYIGVTVKEDEIESRTITLAQVLLSSDKLVYMEEDRIYRGIFDKDKLDDVRDNPNPLLDEISYPDSEYYVMIKDLDNKNTWTIGNRVKSTRNFPVAIRYSDEDIHVGRMSVGVKVIKK